jgi:hypothetical protein
MMIRTYSLPLPPSSEKPGYVAFFPIGPMMGEIP